MISGEHTYFTEGEGRHCVRSISVSLSGRFSKPFLRLSACCLRSSSSCADCSALDLGVSC